MDYFELYYAYLAWCERDNWANYRDPNHDFMEWNHTLPQCIFGDLPIGQWLTIEQHAVASALQTLAWQEKCLCGMHKKHMPPLLWELCMPYYSEGGRKTQLERAKKGEHNLQKIENVAAARERLMKVWESDEYRKEHSERMSEQNRRKAKEGKHPMQTPENRLAASERAKKWAERMISEGNHPSLVEGASERITEQNLQRIRNGTHNFLGLDHAKRSSDMQLQRVREGTHQWKTEEHGERVRSRLKGTKYWVNREGELRREKQKPEGEWINARKWREQ
jgi:hypothetical protein